MGYDVELDFGGTTYKWENQPAALLESFDLFSKSVPIRSAELNLHFDIDVNKKLAEGFRLDACECRILSNGEIEMAGQANDPQWGSANDPVSLSVREVAFDTESTFPGPYEIEQVTVDYIASREASKQRALENIIKNPYVGPGNYNVTVCDKKDLGSVPPVVIGHPGGYESNVNLIWAGSPAIYIDQTTGSEKLLLACHGVSPSGADVWINGPKPNGTDRASVTVTTQTETDLSGRTITTADISGVPPGVFNLTGGTEDWYVSWVGGGLTTIPVNGLGPGAGDVLVALLNQCFGLRLDQGRLEQIVPVLNRYQLAGFIDEQVNPWKYAQEQIIELLPISPVNGPDGLYFAMWEPDAAAVDEMTETHRVSVSPKVAYEGMEIVNDLVLQYRYQADSDTFRKVVEVNSSNNAYANLSQQHYGMRSQVIETALIDDEDTATSIAEWMLRAFAFPPRRISTTCDSARYSGLRVGDNVECDFPSLAINQTGMVCEIERFGEPIMRVDLLIFDDPIRNGLV